MNDLVTVEKMPEPVTKLWFIDVVVKPADAEQASIHHYGVYATSKAEAATKCMARLTLPDAKNLIGINCLVEATDLTGEDHGRTE
jgi:hypothetical protein